MKDSFQTSYCNGFLFYDWDFLNGKKMSDSIGYHICTRDNIPETEL